MPTRRKHSPGVVPLPEAAEAEPQVKVRYRGAGTMRIVHGSYVGEFSTGITQIPERIWVQYLKSVPELERV